MLSFGAVGPTFQQMVDVMHLNEHKLTNARYLIEVYHAFDDYNVVNFIQQLGIMKHGDYNDNFRFVIVNKIYVQEGYELQPSFKEIAMSKFCAKIETVDFSKGDAAIKINRSVLESTNNRVCKVITSKDITEASKLLLISVPIFKARFSLPFPLNKSKEAPFHTSENKKIDVTFMHRTGPYPYAELKDLDATAISFEFVNSAAYFLLILPKKVCGLDELEKKLADPSYNIAEIELTRKIVNIAVPRFKFENRINLAGTLKDMGISNIFRNWGDLSEMIDSKDKFNVSKVIQKLSIDFQEQGISVSNEPEVFTGASSAKATNFRADHPFYFTIIDKTFKDAPTILFSGRYQGQKRVKFNDSR